MSENSSDTVPVGEVVTPQLNRHPLGASRRIATERRTRRQCRGKLAVDAGCSLQRSRGISQYTLPVSFRPGRRNPKEVISLRNSDNCCGPCFYLGGVP